MTDKTEMERLMACLTSLAKEPRPVDIQPGVIKSWLKRSAPHLATYSGKAACRYMGEPILYLGRVDCPKCSERQASLVSEFLEKEGL